MKQPEGFVEKGKEQLVCILKLARKFDVKNLGELHYFLSVQVTKKHKDSNVWNGQWNLFSESME